MSEPLSRDALSDEGVIRGGDVMVRPEPVAAALNLRLDAADGRLRQAVEGALGEPLPRIPGSLTAGASRDVLWLGPDEWLVRGQHTDAPALVDRMAAAVPDDAVVSVTDVTAGQQALCLEGPGSTALLARGCTLDLHPAILVPGRCLRTTLAKAPVILYRRDESPLLRLIVRRSLAPYLWQWLGRANHVRESGAG